MIKDFISMLNLFYMVTGPDSSPDPNIYYRTCIISLVSHFSEQTPVLLDAELGFVDTLCLFRISLLLPIHLA